MGYSKHVMLFGTLMPGAQAVHRLNVNQVWRGHVSLPAGPRTTMFVKRVDRRTIAVEVVCALLASAIGLPCPRPALVKVTPASLPGAVDRDEVFFGSEAVSSPDLRKFVTPEHQEALQRLLSWSKAPQVGSFDEWIGNRDRHVGNILFGGPTEFTLIDHSEAIPAYLTPELPAKRNQIFEFLTASAKDSLHPDQLYLAAKKHTEGYSIKDIDKTALDLLNAVVRGDAASDLLTFLQQRIQYLLPLISQRLGCQQNTLALTDDQFS